MKRIRKLIAGLLAAVLCIGLAACGSSSREGVKTYKVGIAIYQFTDNFMTLYRNELTSYFEELEKKNGCRYELVISDGKNDMSEQSNQIDTFIAMGVDVIILNLVQTSSAEAIIQRILAADIPVVLINREPMGENGDYSFEGILNNPTVCYVGTDARQSGTFQGEIVLEQPNRGDINGDGKISYIMIQGDPENTDAQYRTQYSVKALTDAGLQVECLDSQVGNWEQTKGQEICANALSMYGDKVEVVFCNNDSMALGASVAIEAADRKVNSDIYLLGVDGLDECLEMVKNREMTGTVLNDHITQAHTAVDAAVKLMEKQEVEDYYIIDYVKISCP